MAYAFWAECMAILLGSIVGRTKNKIHHMNLPDIYQQNPSIISEYLRRNAITVCFGCGECINYGQNFPKGTAGYVDVSG